LLDLNHRSGVIEMFPTLPKAYKAVSKVGAYTIAKKADGLFYIFDSEGGINKEAAFTSLERAEKYVPSIDHMVAFSAPIAGVRYIPSWKK
jgi:hypothetical protein